jgi:hypothetical protein
MMSASMRVGQHTSTHGALTHVALDPLATAITIVGIVLLLCAVVFTVRLGRTRMNP